MACGAMKRFRRIGISTFLLLADFEPKGEVCFVPTGLIGQRMYFRTSVVCELIKNGVIAWSYCSPIAVNPGADGILKPLKRFVENRTLRMRSWTMLKVPADLRITAKATQTQDVR